MNTILRANRIALIKYLKKNDQKVTVDEYEQSYKSLSNALSLGTQLKASYEILAS